MCGITGIWYLDNKKLTEEMIASFNNSLAHRGPDGFGTFIDTELSLGIGQRRLAILDLTENGKQPMVYRNRYWMVFNGEIFNFIELKEELVSIGYTFQSESDTEVVLAAYMHWGKECLHKFNGMWAFAIWDTQEKTLFLARDRFGVKPLYYLFLPGNIFAFASETIAFKHLDGYVRKIDEKKLNFAVRNPFQLEGHGHTIFRDIYQLLPGHYIELSQHTVSISQKRWWSTLKNIHTDIPLEYADRVEKFKKTFTDSCRIRLRSDVPVGTALSGGVDSSAVYSMIHNLMRNSLDKQRIPADWQRAFVATFPDTSLDEKKYAEEVVAYTGGNATYIVPDSRHIVEKIIKSTILFDSIYVTPLSVVSEIYKAMRENGVRVSMDGHGVDEMLFGYQSLFKTARSYLVNQNNENLLQEVFGKNWQENTSFVLGKTSNIKNKIKEALQRNAPRFLKKVIDIYNTFFKKDTINITYLGEKEDVSKLNELEMVVFNTFHLSTLPTILRNFDRASMQYGVEIRMPFMDWRLVTFVFSLPITDKINNGFTKKILRDSMIDIMPEDIRLRKSKIGLNAPLMEWFSGPLKEFIYTTVQSENFRIIAGSDFQKLKTMVEKNSSKNTWTWSDCATLWPYINATILLDNN